jgi:hypothetical protein
MRAKFINEIKQDKNSGLSAIGVGADMVFPTCMKRLIDEYDLYYLTNFDPDKIYEDEAHYQFFIKITKFLKCSIKDIILVDLEGMTQIEQNDMLKELKLSVNENITEYDDNINKNTYHIQACLNFALIENTTKNSYDGDCIAINNTKFKFFK